jgi:MauM/NapG family ferredoxin protein
VLAGLLLSVVTVAATVLFGRVFCGWVCPMGAVFDLCACAFPPKTRRAPYGKGLFANVKFHVIAFFVLGSLFGLTFVFFLDPLVFLFRVFTLNLHPAVIFAANGALNGLRGTATSLGFTRLSMLSYQQPAFVFGLFSLLMFLAVIGLIYVERRFWCRNLCPLGALLSLVSRFSVWGRRVSDACITCSKCAQVCPMNAIGEDFHTTSAHECIQCERCAAVCPTAAISFGFHTPGVQRYAHSPSRRGLIAAAAGGVLAAVTASASVSRQTIHEKLIRPPGARVEKDFLDSCLRCGECMKACPTHGLQPAVSQAGFEGFFTPVLVSRIGGCEDTCNLCGRVCPTGAIRSLPLEEKRYAVIGNAAIDRSRCIAWEQGKLCLVCDEACPYDSIEFRMVADEKGTIQRPFVIEDKCIGCGQCEHACPVNGHAAIYVTPTNEVRKNSGSYITEKMKRLRGVKDEGIDFFQETGTSRGISPKQSPAPPDSAAGEELPPGFIR